MGLIKKHTAFVTTDNARGGSRSKDFSEMIWQ